MFSFLADIIHGLEAIWELTARVWGGFGRLISWIMTKAWAAYVAIICFFWGIVNAVIAGFDRALESLGIIKEKMLELGDIPVDSVESPFFVSSVEFLNNVLPLQEAINFCAAYLSLMAACALYKLIKSWVPFL